MTPKQVPGPPCAGCLGNRQCWVCLGAGRSERSEGGFNPCMRCAGTGRCHVCRPATVVQVEQVDLNVGPQLPRAAADGPLHLDDGRPLRLDAEPVEALLS